MTKKTLTKKEEAAVARLKKAFDMLPNNLIVYTVDSSVMVCKKGTPSFGKGTDDLVEYVNEDVYEEMVSACVLQDMHDDMNFGRGGGWEPHIRPIDR